MANARMMTIAPDGKSITCHVCGMTSFNPHDVENLYCGHCHAFGERSDAATFAGTIEPCSSRGSSLSANNGGTDMAKQYQGKNVRSMRDARDGDPGFQRGGDQVVITFDDGNEKTVQRSEVTEGGGQQSGR